MNKWRDSKASLAQGTAYKHISTLQPFPNSQDNGGHGGTPYYGGSSNSLSLCAGSSKGSSYSASTSQANNKGGITRSLEGEVQALATAQQEMVTKSDLEALLKALKESGITGHTFTASFNGSCYATNQLNPLIVDSGASHHMISDPRLISDIEPALGNVMIANGERVPIKGIGNLRLFEKDSKAFYMPTFTSNLLSVKRATTDLNCYAIFGPNDFFFQDIESNKVIGRGGTKDDLYVLEDPKSSSTTFSLPMSNNVSGLNVIDNPDTAALWHARVGHPHLKALELMFPRISFNNDACEACILGKHCRTVFHHSKTVYNKCFELVHSDVWTAPCESRENQKYFVTFIDEKSKYTWLTLLPSKDRVLEAFKNFHTYITNHYHVQLKCLRSDNGGEYTSHAFKSYLSQHGIIHQTSCPHTPQQNGVAERKNRHLMDVARSIMHVPKRFWSDAVVMACYLINRTPTRILGDKSPFEVLHKLKPSLDHLRVFGCVCFVFVSGDQRNKLEAKSTRAMFIGYSPTQKGYKCYVPDTRRVLISRDVKFLETTSFYGDQKWEEIKDINSNPAANLRLLLERMGLPSFSPSSQKDTSSSTPPTPSCQSPHPNPEGGQSESNIPYHDHDDELPQVQEDQESQPVGNQESQPGESDEHLEEATVSNEGNEVGELRRSKRLKFPPENWKNTRVYYNYNVVAHPDQTVCNLATIPHDHQVFIGVLDQECVPRSYEEAKNQKVWREAVNEEHQAMERNHTWIEAILPKGKKAVSSRWILTIKYRRNGEI